MNKTNPPSWSLNLLRFFCKERYLEQIEGDLMEIYSRDTPGRGARWRFAWNTLRFFRLRYLKGLDDFEQLTTLAMIKNYLKVAFRTLIRQRSYAGINIGGLAVGLASCLLIVMYIFHEQSYDRFYPELDQMYRVANGERGAWTPPLLSETMMNEYAQVEHATRIIGVYDANFRIGERSFMQPGGAIADPNMFHVFETEFLSGTKETALVEPSTVVLDESLALKCFPDEPAMGQSVMIDGETYKISGVVKDLPKNTHFPYQFVTSQIEPDHRNWTGNSVRTYAKVTKGVTVAEMNSKLQELYANRVGPEIIGYTGHSSFEEFTKDYPDRYFGFTLHPVSDIHLYHPNFSFGKSGNYKNVIIFSSIALFVLLIACVNYINMSTARAAIRSKEVGIRKTLGSNKKNIITQFLTESLLITFFAVLLAIVISVVSLNYFNDLTGRQFDFGDLFSITSLLAIIGLLVIVGLCAGAYPSYVISNFSPLKALRGHMRQSGKNGLRSILVMFQFAISVFLVAATIVIYQQLKHMQSQELGVNIDHVLVMNSGNELGENYDLFKNLLESRTDVSKVAKASNIPFHGYGDWGYRTLDEDNLRANPMNAFVEPGIEDVLDLEISKGRFLQSNLITDTASVVINESLAAELGWNDPIGKRLTRGEGLDFTVVGVMKDFNYASLKREISPMIFRYAHNSIEVGEWHQRYVLAKINSSDVLRTIEEIEDIWNQQSSEYPFDALFLDESFQREYEGERKFGQVFTTFSVLAILIAFLGLFALTTFVLQKRFKEIAVRKVLGATVNSLLRMIIRDFTRLVIMGGFVGIAVAFFWLESWLEDYSYRIELTWYMLALPVVLVLTLTWLLVSLKSYRAALANPANALKDE